VSGASPLVIGLTLVTSSIMSVVSGASPLIMSVVSLVMCVAYGQTQFPVSGAAYNFGATLLTLFSDLEDITFEIFETY
jgi:hypothetical protein